MQCFVEGCPESLSVTENVSISKTLPTATVNTVKAMVSVSISS